MVNTCHEYQLYGGLASANNQGAVTTAEFLAREGSRLFKSTNRYDEQVLCNPSLHLPLGAAYILIWALLLPLFVIWQAHWVFVLDCVVFIIEFLLLVVQHWVNPLAKLLRGLLALLVVSILIVLRVMLHQKSGRTSRERLLLNDLTKVDIASYSCICLTIILGLL